MDNVLDDASSVNLMANALDDATFVDFMLAVLGHTFFMVLLRYPPQLIVG